MHSSGWDQNFLLVLAPQRYAPGASWHSIGMSPKNTCPPHRLCVDSDTPIHCWIPASLRVSNDSNKSNQNPKPVLLLIPGFGVHAIWHWNAHFVPIALFLRNCPLSYIFFFSSLRGLSQTGCERDLCRPLFVNSENVGLRPFAARLFRRNTKPRVVRSKTMLSRYGPPTLPFQLVFSEQYDT